MSNAIPQTPAGELISTVPAVNAANADDIVVRSEPCAQPIEATGGWDAYEVWRRFIKEARERRRNAPGSD